MRRLGSALIFLAGALLLAVAVLGIYLVFLEEVRPLETFHSTRLSLVRAMLGQTLASYISAAGVFAFLGVQVLVLLQGARRGEKASRRTLWLIALFLLAVAVYFNRYYIGLAFSPLSATCLFSAFLIGLGLSLKRKRFLKATSATRYTP